MQKNPKSSGKPLLRFQEIVDSIPDEVAAFFQKFESSRDRLTLTQEVDVLNAVANEEYLACAGTGGKSGRRPTALMRWYEVFRDIYILSRVERSDNGEVNKNPNALPRLPGRSSRSPSCRISGSRRSVMCHRRTSAPAGTGCGCRLRDFSTNVRAVVYGGLWTGR